MEKNSSSNKFKKFIHGRSLKYGSNSLLLIVVVVAIAIFINILVGIPGLKWDLTPNKLYTLEEVSTDILNELDQDVTIYALFDDVAVKGTDYEEVTELLNLYKKNAHITIEYVDPVKNPGIIKTLDEGGTMELANGDFVITSDINGQLKKKKLGYYDLFATTYDSQTASEYRTGSIAEQGITGAIKYVTSEETPVVYFTTGHGEVVVDEDYKTIKQYLEKNNYEVKTLNLITNAQVPEDAEILIVAAPRSDITAQEKDMISAFFKSGGKGVFLFDYLDSGVEFAVYNQLLSEFNLSVNNDKIKENDSQRHLPDDQYTVLVDVASSEVIPQAFNIVLQDSRSIGTLKNEKAYLNMMPLLTTSDKAVGVSVNDMTNEAPGPLDIAVAVENTGSDLPSKILVMGNALFISDSAAEVYGSYYEYGVTFFLQAVNWMFDSDDQIIVPEKNYENNLITITQMQSVVLGIVVTILVPLIILGLGFLVYIRRRHL